MYLMTQLFAKVYRQHTDTNTRLGSDVGVGKREHSEHHRDRTDIKLNAGWREGERTSAWNRLWARIFDEVMDVPADDPGVQVENPTPSTNGHEP
jgi:hypothetical protein